MKTGFRFGLAAGCALLGSLLGVLLEYSGVLDEFEARSWDIRQHFAASMSQPEPSPISLVVVDQEDLDRAADKDITWPWPRAEYGKLLLALETLGVKAVGFDILFTERSSRGELDDKAFAEFHSEATIPVIHGSVLSASPWADEFDRAQFLQLQRTARLPRLPKEIKSTLNRSRSATLPIAELTSAGVSLAHVNGAADSDGIFRFHQPVRRLDSAYLLSLPAALYASQEGAEAVFDLVREYSASDGALAVDYSQSKTAYRVFHARDLIEFAEAGLPSPFPDEFRALKGSLAVVGYWAPGLYDIRPHPLNNHARGVNIQAYTLANFLAGRFAKKSDEGSESLFIAALCVVSSFASVFITALSFKALFSFLILIGYAALTLFFALNAVWLPLVVPLLCAGLALLFSLLFQNHFEGQQRRFIKKAFEHYLSPQVIEEILKSPENLKLGGQRKELTIFFSDLAGFTSLSEGLSPEQLSSLLNDYLSAMTEIILEHSGTLDKYEGDAILAFWNAPNDVERHALVATEVAIRCQERLAELNPEFESKYGVQLRMRIGVHTGVVTVGNFGARERFDYTIIGDAANLASRLEGANKFFGTSILVSEATAEAAGEGLLLRKVGKARVQGRESVELLFEPTAKSEIWTAQALERFAAGLSLYEQGKLSEAKAVFEEFGADPLSRRYLEKLSEQSESDWSPELAIWVLDGK